MIRSPGLKATGSSTFAIRARSSSSTVPARRPLPQWSARSEREKETVRTAAEERHRLDELVDQVGRLRPPLALTPATRLSRPSSDLSPLHSIGVRTQQCVAGAA
jgi:hypothetical protein